MEGPDIYLLSGSSYCHGEKEAFFSASSPRNFFFRSLLFLSTLQSSVSFIFLIVLFADKLCHSLKFVVAFHMQIAPWPALSK